MRLTRPEREAVEAHVAALLEPLGLEGWRVELDEDDAEEGCVAQVRAVEGQRLAWMRFSPRLRDDPREREIAGQTILHELLHLVLAGVEQHTHTLAGPLGGPAYGVWRAGYHQHEERAIDALATGLAPLLPAFAWPPADTNGERP